MWNWIRCYVTGHDYCVSCERGAMFLRRRTASASAAPRDGKVSAKSSHTHSHSLRALTRRTARGGECLRVCPPRCVRER